MQNKIIDVQYFMDCGCVLDKKQLILHATMLACPKHFEGVTYIEKPCARCGEILISHSWGSNRIFCKNCYAEISLARTIYSQKDIERIFIDPILWHKTTKETLDDISFNVQARFKKNPIQINIPREVQHDLSFVIINMQEKLDSLQENTKEPLCKNSQELN